MDIQFTILLAISGYLMHLVLVNARRIESLETALVKFLMITVIEDEEGDK
jgi:hypothetical protein